MIRPLLLTVALLLLAAFFLLGWLARAAGALQPSNPALAGFTIGCEDKPQPCWYGIVPGVTTVDETRRILEDALLLSEMDAGYSLHAQPDTVVDCQRIALGLYALDVPVNALSLVYCSDLNLGSLVAALGPPDVLIVHCDAEGAMSLWWENLGVASIRISPRASYWLSPVITVPEFTFVRDYGLSESSRPFTYAWHGFASRQRYRQLHPDARCLQLEE